MRIGIDACTELRAAMQQLQASPALRAELGERGRRAALERWTEDVHLDRYLALVSKLAERRAVSARAAH